MSPTHCHTKLIERYRQLVEVYFTEPLDADDLAVGSFIQDTIECDISLPNQTKAIKKGRKKTFVYKRYGVFLFVVFVKVTFKNSNNSK